MHALLLAITFSQLVANAQRTPVCWAAAEGVSEENAATIAEVQLRLTPTSDPIPAEDRVLFEERLRAGLKAKGERLPLLITIAQLHASTDESEEAFVGSIQPLLRAEPDPVEAILRIAERTGWPRSQQLVGAALGVYRDDIDLLEVLAESHPLGAAIGPARIGRRVTLRATARKLPPDRLALYAERQIAELLMLGRGTEATALFDLLPEVARSWILRGEPKAPWRNVPIGLAAAAILTGNDDRARELVQFAKAFNGYDPGFPAALEIIMAALQARSTDDVFDVIVTAAAARPAGTVAQLYANVLERGGYPSLAAEVLRNTASAYEVADTDAPPAIAADLETLEMLIEADVRSLRARADALAPQVDHGAPLRRLLETRRLSYFHEHPMPEHSDTHAELLRADGSYLGGFAFPIRIERIGDERVALGSAQTLDPMGYDVLGAYWLFRSQDDGKTWSAYYTGLRSGDPYTAIEGSQFPLLDGDRVRIEVQDHRYIEIAWSDLTRDSDHDGLTDLVEERIVTDPNDADSDDDGTPDGRDFLPQIARGESSSPFSGVVAEALFGMRPNDEPSERSGDAIDEETHFMIGDPAMFASIEATSRTIVLTKGDLELYEKKFGFIFGLAIRHLVIDQSGTRAVIEFDEQWAAERLLLWKSDHGWNVTHLLHL